MFLRAMLLVVLFPVFAFAQGRDWQVTMFENSATKGAELTSPNQRLTLYCGEVLNGDTGLNELVNFPGVGHFHLLSPTWIMGEYTAASNGEQNVSAFTLLGEISLPPFYFDEMGGTGWISRVPFNHPFIAMIMNGAEIGITPELAFEFYLWPENFAASTLAAMKHCRGEEPVEEPRTVQTTQIDAGLHGLIQTQAFAQCQAAYDLPASAYQVQDVTGDGVDDVIVNFGKLKCTDGLFANLPAGYACPTGMCMHHIFTTEASTPIILGATRIEAVPDTTGTIWVFMDDPSCSAMGRAAGCKVRSKWMSQTFATVGLE